MAEYKNDDLGVSFEIPDKITVRKQLAFYSAASAFSGEMQYGRYWAAAMAVIENWKSELIPDPAKLDMDDESNPSIATAIIWVSNTAIAHLNRLEAVPKN